MTMAEMVAVEITTVVGDTWAHRSWWRRSCICTASEIHNGMRILSGTENCRACVMVLRVVPFALATDA
jgi:hypothetical protein